MAYLLFGLFFGGVYMLGGLLIWWVTRAIGMLPYFLGLLVVLPVLGHASWHLYRQAFSPGEE